MDKTCHHVRTNLLDVQYGMNYFSKEHSYFCILLCFYEIHHQYALNILYIFRENTDLGKKNDLRKSFAPVWNPSFQMINYHQELASGETAPRY